jgi:hypothetical protein
MFFVARLSRQSQSAEPLTARFARATVSRRESLALGDWRIDLITWTVDASNAPTMFVQRTAEHIRVVVTSARAMTTAGDALARAPTTESALDALEPLLCDFSYVELAADGTLGLATDFLGNGGMRHRRAADGATVVGNEIWSLLANSGADSAGLPDRPVPHLNPRVITRIPADSSPVTHVRSERLSPEPIPRTHSVRTRLAQSIERIASGSTTGILLSGGIDSSAVAAAARDVIGPQHLTLIHLRWPNGARAFETEHAFSTARRLGLPLHIIDLTQATTLSKELLVRNVGRHPWLGWWFFAQRRVASFCQVALMGSGGEMFGGDDRALLWKGICGLNDPYAVLDVLPAIGFKNIVNATLGRGSPPLSVNDYPWTKAGGKIFSLANPFAGPPTPVYCPYTNSDVIALARRAEGTGLRVAKLALRAAFAAQLPKKVVATPRHGTPVGSVLRAARPSAPMITDDELRFNSWRWTLAQHLPMK